MKTCPKCKAPCNDDQTYCVCGYNFKTGLTSKDLENLDKDYDLPDFMADLFRNKGVKWR